MRKLARRGLRGVKLVVSDAHEGIKATVTKVLNASWQRCRVHFMRNVLAHAGKSGRRVVSAIIATAFAQDDAEAARTQWRKVADQLRPKLPKLAGLLDEAETDVLAYVAAGGVKPFKSPERPKRLDGLEGWLRERLIRHRGNADVVRQDLLAEKGVLRERVSMVCVF